MFITDERFFCEALDTVNYPALSGIGDTFKEKGLEAAEKQLCDIAEAYVASQLERGFSSLDYWKGVSYKG